MGLVSGIVVYTMIWWLVLFTVLPWGARPENQVQQGNASSAPQKPRLVLKFIITTLLSTLLWTAVHFLISYKVIKLDI